MPKVEFTNKGLPADDKALGEHLEEIRAQVMIGGKATDEALERVAADIKVAHEAVDEAKRATKKVTELEETLRALHESGRIGSDDSIQKQLRNLPRLYKVEKDEDYRGKMDPGFFNVLNLTRKELEMYLDGDALAWAKRFRKLNDTVMSAHHILSILASTSIQRTEDYARKGGIKGTEMWEVLQDAAKPALRALSTSQAGGILEWVPNGYSSNLWEDARDQYAIAGQFDFVSMPQNPFILPTWLSGMTPYLIPEATSNTAASNTAITPSDLTSGNRTLAAKKIATLAWFSPEAEQDSIISLLPQFQIEQAYAHGGGVEDIVLNGQSTATIDTGSDPATTDPRDGFDGLRYNASLVGAPVDISAGLTAEKLVAMIEAAGKYANPAQCFFGTGYKGMARALILKDGNGNLVYLTRERAGDQATLFTGTVGILMGYPLVVSGKYPQNMNNSGVIDGLSTKTGFIFCNKTMFKGGNRTGMEVDRTVDERFSTDQVGIRSKQRVAFRSLVAASAARPFVVAAAGL